MAREKGTGSLQREKSGRYTLRVGINGKRYSRSTRTTDRAKAELMLDRFLAPFGLGSRKIPLAEVWHHYEMSPQRKDVAKSTMNAKRVAWMRFARWIEANHVEITHLGDVTDIAIAEYLAEYRCHHSASTYNGHVCTLREVFQLLAEKAGLMYDPWYGVRLLSDDSLSRRELTIDEVERLYMQAEKQGSEWKLLIMTGIYTGLRLGDCCHLKWEDVNLERGIIQVIPEKTKKHMHGRPVSIPIHPQLKEALQELTALSPASSTWSAYVNPKVAEYHIMTRWRVDEGLQAQACACVVPFASTHICFDFGQRRRSAPCRAEHRRALLVGNDTSLLPRERGCASCSGGGDPGNRRAHGGKWRTGCCKRNFRRACHGAMLSRQHLPPPQAHRQNVCQGVDFRSRVHDSPSSHPIGDIRPSLCRKTLSLSALGQRC